VMIWLFYKIQYKHNLENNFSTREQDDKL
jgi:hypothetical protein